jgi:hypothetical protein
MLGLLESGRLKVKTLVTRDELRRKFGFREAPS